MKYRQTKTLMVPDTMLFGFHEKETRIIARTPLQKQRDRDGTQHSRTRPSVLLPVERLYVTDKISKGSFAAKLPDYHHPPQTDPCMTVCDYIQNKPTGLSGYEKLTDQPRDPNTNRRLAQKPILDRATTPAPRDPYAVVKKSLISFQDKLSNLI